jgi:hypothetical protein
MARLSRPLDRESVRQADAQIYDRHANDSRPNALYDANGNRRRLHPSDPAQAELRREWVALYRESLADAPAAAEPSDSGSSPDRPVADPVQPCPNKHWVHVSVVPRPDAEPRPHYWAPRGGNPYAGEAFNARLTNGEQRGSLDGSGSMRADGIPAGACALKMAEFFKRVEESFERGVVFTPG